MDSSKAGNPKTHLHNNNRYLIFYRPLMPIYTHTLFLAALGRLGLYPLFQDAHALMYEYIVFYSSTDFAINLTRVMVGVSLCTRDTRKWRKWQWPTALTGKKLPGTTHDHWALEDPCAPDPKLSTKSAHQASYNIKNHVLELKKHYIYNYELKTQAKISLCLLWSLLSILTLGLIQSHFSHYK